MHRLRTKKLRDIARAHGDTTDIAIAKRAGLNKSIISRLLNGRVQPGTDTLLRLCRAYNATTDDLMEPIEDAA